MEVTTNDQPGLLYSIATIISSMGLMVTNAKITTLGEKVEDIFFLTDNQQQAVTDPELLDQLKSKIKSALEKGQD